MNGWREECLRRFKQTQKYNNYDKEDLVEELIEKEQELQRKDNIINEIKEYLEKEIARGRSEDNVWLMGCYDEDREILDKINELKGDNK